MDKVEIIKRNQEGMNNMRIWQGLLLGIAAYAGSTYANECEDIAFEENDCAEVNGEMRCRRHYHLPEYNAEEEHMWQERSESSWAGKRDDNFIDAFIHQ